MQVGPHSKCVLTAMPDYLVGLDCWCWRKEKSPCSNWSWNFQIPSITRNQWRAWEESLTTAWVTRHRSNINQRLETWLVSTNKSGLPEKSKVWIYQPRVCSWHSSIRSQLSQSRASRGGIILRKLLLNLKPEHHNLVGAEKQVCRYVAPPKCQGLDVCFFGRGGGCKCIWLKNTSGQIRSKFLFNYYFTVLKCFNISLCSLHSPVTFRKLWKFLGRSNPCKHFPLVTLLLS